MMLRHSKAARRLKVEPLYYALVKQSEISVEFGGEPNPQQKSLPPAKSMAPAE